MHIRALRFDFHRIDMQMRFPFRYGIASVSELVHLLVDAEVQIDGEVCHGVAADGLAPKWFTKNADTTFEEDDLPSMRRVIRQAADLAVRIGPQPSVFSWWRELYQAQHAWAKCNRIPPLLAGFGVSLIERAVIDAFCRRHQLTFFDALQKDAFQIELGSIRSSLASCRVCDVLPRRPRPSVRLRHTIGLGDPLTDDDINTSERISDGLPQSLESCLDEYALKYFKIKLSGDDRRDALRLSRLATIFQKRLGTGARFTLDGNEQYDSMAAFAASWDALRSTPDIRNFIDRGLLFVEQPIHRDHALREPVKDALKSWPDAPPIIIDESDAELESLPTALELGYSGTSHKNCKGVFKSLAAAATIATQGTPETPLIHSAEDLVNVGPVALLQDLAVVGALGITHVERNGHHYFAGLSMLPDQTQQQVADTHPDLYRMLDRGFATVTTRDGALSLRTVNAAPFGAAELPDLTRFESWEL